MTGYLFVCNVRKKGPSLVGAKEIISLNVKTLKIGRDFTGTLK